MYSCSLGNYVNLLRKTYSSFACKLVYIFTYFMTICVQRRW